MLRAALTETCSVYPRMPAAIAELAELRPRLEELRACELAHHVELLTRAAAAGVELVCLGELFAAPYFALSRDPMWLELAEDAVDGPSVTTLRDVAARLNMIIVAPIYELDRTSGKRFDTAVVIDEHGELLGKYRKAHIPMGTNEQSSFFETDYYEASDGELGEWPANISTSRHFPVFETSRVRLGVSICYDRHFPRVIETLADNHAELVVSPAVTFGAKSRRLWALEFEVDSARHNLFIGASNRRGIERPWGQEYFGASHFVGPNGPVGPLAGPPELVIADLDLDELRGPDPSGWNLVRDRRSIY